MRKEYSLCDICKTLGLARSSYDYAKKHPKQLDKEEVQHVRRAFIEHHQSFGRRHLHQILKRKGVNISERKIARIMKKLGLEARHGRRKIAKNIHTSEEKYISENLFKTADENKIVWCTDFTEFKTIEGKLYLGGIIDVKHKILVGHNALDKATTEIVTVPLIKATQIYGCPDILHNDRGAQYTSRALKLLCIDKGILQSMSAPRRPNENQPIESFWKTLKAEMGSFEELTKKEAIMVIDYYINYYNTKRPHSSLGYKTPEESYKQSSLSFLSNF